ncbi:PREDICTED: uncharacterized protein LOC106147111 [Chinchilla lanigera]|uniref:uncharacterized protein LOC106147111 n=1 Tax=Chinchilla lanigera TaxID=34839 RepID=UPI000697AC12|nr:PREDICTED: uncharacterized protein LOC106147111 [Chinchilla lanigera]
MLRSQAATEGVARQEGELRLTASSTSRLTCTPETAQNAALQEESELSCTWNIKAAGTAPLKTLRREDAGAAARSSEDGGRSVFTARQDFEEEDWQRVLYCHNFQRRKQSVFLDDTCESDWHPSAGALASSSPTACVQDSASPRHPGPSLRVQLLPLLPLPNGVSGPGFRSDSLKLGFTRSHPCGEKLGTEPGGTTLAWALHLALGSPLQRSAILSPTLPQKHLLLTLKRSRVVKRRGLSLVHIRPCFELEVLTYQVFRVPSVGWERTAFSLSQTSHRCSAQFLVYSSAGEVATHSSDGQGVGLLVLLLRVFRSPTEARATRLNSHTSGVRRQRVWRGHQDLGTAAARGCEGRAPAPDLFQRQSLGNSVIKQREDSAWSPRGVEEDRDEESAWSPRGVEEDRDDQRRLACPVPVDFHVGDSGARTPARAWCFQEPWHHGEGKPFGSDRANGSGLCSGRPVMQGSFLSVGLSVETGACLSHNKNTLEDKCCTTDFPASLKNSPSVEGLWN